MRILFASDVSFHPFGDQYPGGEVAHSAMAEARACFDRADFSVINLESVIANRRSDTPISKSGPNLSFSPSFLGFLEALAPSAACLANNHTGDYGDEPIRATLCALRELGILPFGAGETIREAYRPAVFEKDGERVAMIGVCENEFGIAKEDKAGAAGYSLGRVTEAIRSAREQGNTPVVFFHGGNEHNPFPSPKKQELYRHFVDLGACAVIAMHTHCPQGYEVYRNAPIVYSMGNFFFPAAKGLGRLPVWNYGYMALVSIENGIARLEETIPYRQDFSGVHLLENEELKHFRAYQQAIALPLCAPALLEQYFNAWCLHRDYCAKFSERYPREGSAAFIRNLLWCEAHNEVASTEARLRFEGINEPDPTLLSHLLTLQQMEIPADLQNKT